jgi:hypothetical protein
MISFKTASTLLATAAVLSLAPISNAEAALVSAASPTCSINDIINPTATACSGSWDGNDANQQTDVLAKLLADFGVNTGSGTWAFGGKSDDASNGPFTSNPNTSNTGLLTFDTAKTGYFAVALKASNSFSLYLLNGGTSGISSFDFNTKGTATNSKEKSQDLSHASLYTFAGSSTPVPTPALLPGLIGMGVAALRKRKGEAEESAEA